MKHLLPLLSIVLMLSCARFPLLPNEYGRRDGWDSHEGHVYHRDPPEDEDSLYISGVEYPPGYDWVRDTAHSSVCANLLLFRGGKEILRIKAGGEELWSVDPDSHRIWNGHLYTFAARGGKSIIGMDGKVILEYDGEESIRGFALDGGRILTLGQLAGETSSVLFRVDGKTVFRADGACIRGSLDKNLPRSGALYGDKEHWYFSYTQGGRLHLVEDNRELQLPLEESWTDVLMLDGKLYLAGIRTLGKYSCFYARDGDIVHYLDAPLQASSATFRFMAWNGLLRIVVSDGAETCIWDYPSPYIKKYYGNEIELFPRKEGDILLFSRAGKMYRMTHGELPEGTYTLFSGACAVYCGDGLAVGLSGLDGSPNTVLREGLAHKIPFNGPITSLSVG